MTTFQTPGIYFERAKTRTVAPAQRTDVAGFIGVAERGPLHTPSRIENWREYQQVFGSFLPHAYLPYAVYAFFENGGQACWVVRVADAEAARASWINVPHEKTEEPPLSAAVRAIDPGGWGDQLQVVLLPAQLLETRHRSQNGLLANQLAVQRTAGLYIGSRVNLTQQLAAETQSINPLVMQVNAITGILTFNVDVTEFDRTPKQNPKDVVPIVVKSLEFTLQVVRDNQILERFANLGYEPQHPRYAVDIVNNQSRQIRIQPMADFPLPVLPWRGNLRGGLDGLRTLDVLDYIGDPASSLEGLAALEKVDEVSILAIPDLVMRAEPPQAPERSHRIQIDKCDLKAPRTDFTLIGVVKDAESRLPLAGTVVTVNDGTREPSCDPASPFNCFTTGMNGDFKFEKLLPKDIDLTVNFAGYEEYQERIRTPIANAVVEVLLKPLNVPPPLSEDDIFLAQQAMIEQCERLHDRFAILDAPLNVNGHPRDLGEVIIWRQHFDSEYAALYHPWLIARDPVIVTPYTARLLPPSGHAAGIYAATDLDQGVFRAPANRLMTFVDDVTIMIDDAAQGALNPIGINAIRSFPGRGIRIFGARTLMTTRGTPFVNVRRFLNMLVETLFDGLQWAVFEPINPDLQASLRLWITRLLNELWRKGALVGASPEEAYRVRCDDSTTLQDDRDNGRVIVEVEVSPSVPYEFILLRLGFTLDELVISEV